MRVILAMQIKQCIICSSAGLQDSGDSLASCAGKGRTTGLHAAEMQPGRHLRSPGWSRLASLFGDAKLHNVARVPVFYITKITSLQTVQQWYDTAMCY